MSLPHVLLGLLSDQPATGYDLERAMREELEGIWRAELSQIYPELARLRRAGFVLLRVLGPRRGPRRNLFRITAAGRRELRRWVAEPPAALRGRDDVLARAAFFDALGGPERAHAAAAQQRALSEEVDRLRAAGPLSGSRREARRMAVEKLEIVRRSLGALADGAAAAAPISVPAPRGASPRKK